MRVVTQKGELCTLPKDELSLGYRTSTLSKNSDIVLEAVFKLVEGDQGLIQEKMNDLLFKGSPSSRLNIHQSAACLNVLLACSLEN